MKENNFQAELIKELNDTFPGCLILKNDANYLQGIPDLTIFYKTHWAFLECKKSCNEPFQPNQEYYLALAYGMSYSACIYPENKREVIRELQQAFRTRG